MAWRIHESVVRGEINNRVKGRVTGRIWFEGREEPLDLNLQGNAWRDLAGYRLRFSNASPKVGDLDGLKDLQEGVVGDMTASRKVKIPDCTLDEIGDYCKRGEAFPFHWGNCLYLEWFSERNGRVVVESADYILELDEGADWKMTEAEEVAQQQANQEAITGFMGRLLEAVDPAEYAQAPTFEEEDAPTSQAEADAVSETARMDLLLDRVMARMEKEGHDEDAFERIMMEERERLGRERGEPEPEPLTPEEAAEEQAWILEMNAVTEQALEAAEFEEAKRHPLVEACGELGIRLHHEVENHAWIPEGASRENPLNEVTNGIQSAGVKLAGALSGHLGGQEWPPDPMFAGHTLVRLKKAREYLRDALAGLDAAEEERLANDEWRGRTRVECNAVFHEIQRLIDEVRSVLE